MGWTGQPLIIRWDEDIRKLMNIKPELKETDLVEVIYPTLDGNIYFLNLDDGKPTRDPINIGFSTKGTGMIDPRGYPILYTGQGLNQNGDNFAHHKFRIFSLIDQTELFSITGTTPNHSGCGVPLILAAVAQGNRHADTAGRKRDFIQD